MNETNDLIRGYHEIRLCSYTLEQLQYNQIMR